MDSRSVGVALLGCGTVGGGVVRLLKQNGQRYVERIGAPVILRHILVRDLARAQVDDEHRSLLTTDVEAVLNDPNVQIIIEVMGGENPAHDYIQRALKAGKSVVSANKFLLAKYGPDLVELANANSVDLAFEASVGGGIAVIRTLREALTSDRVKSIHAIMNGTCNYILTRMRSEGIDFEPILKDAQALGYAEAEPSLDIDGHDAAQKLILLAMLAFGAKVREADILVEGIRDIQQIDFTAAKRFGFAIKHLAIGIEHSERLELRVHPTLVPLGSVLAHIDDVLNGVHIEGEALGPCYLIGRGAGEKPTAVSVVSDVVDLARSILENSPGISTRALRPKTRELVPVSEISCRYYLRFDVADRPGVLGTIASILGKHHVSLEQMFQEGAPGDDRPASVIMLTHRCLEGEVQAALDEIAKTDFMVVAPRRIRVESP